MNKSVLITGFLSTPLAYAGPVASPLKLTPKSAISHREYFIKNRFALLDAKYGTSNFTSDNVDMYLSRIDHDLRRVYLPDGVVEDYVCLLNIDDCFQGGNVFPAFMGGP